MPELVTAAALALMFGLGFWAGSDLSRRRRRRSDRLASRMVLRRRL